MKYFKVLVAASALSFAVNVHAAPIPGFSDVTNNLDGTYTFTFDTLSSDISNLDGLTFSGAGIGFTVTGSNAVTGSAVTIQDVPANGGLGVDGDPNGDNMGLGEWLSFSFDQSVDLVMINFNGDHTDATSGMVEIAADGNQPLYLRADWFDGVLGPETPISDISAENASFYGFSGMTDLRVAPTTYASQNYGIFNGYVESITVRSSPVPEPTTMLLFGTGIAGLAAVSRRRKK